MEIDEIIQNIFGPDELLYLLSTKLKKESSKSSRIVNALTLVDKYIEATFLNNTPIHVTKDKRIGRIGPNVVRFDRSNIQGDCTLSSDTLTVISESILSTLRANVAVYKGKWLYELQLGSIGVMQLGWSSIICRINQTSAVGNTIHSYAYNGNHLKKWNVSTQTYGDTWLTGDFIGCALDMDNGTVDFYRNGKHLGRAFENITMGASFAYFPTVSLTAKENLVANFGSTPLKYPVEGYEPLQAAPQKEITETTYLFKWFLKIIQLMNEKQNSDEQNMLNDGNMSISNFLMCLSRSVLKHIGPLITIPYITEYVVVPFIEQLPESNTRSKQDLVQSSMLSTCLDLLWTFLEEHEMKAFLENTVLYLLYIFKNVSSTFDYPDQFRSLLLLTKICRHTSTRQYLLQHLLFDRVRFIDFMDVKILNEKDFIDVLEKVWSELHPEEPMLKTNETSYLDACDKIKAAISELETVQMELLITVLDNSDGNENRPTSRAIFLRKFKCFVQGRSIVQPSAGITYCCFYRLLVTFRTLWDKEVGTSPVYFPCRVFYDASINYYRTERLGGVLSHLTKMFRSELVEQLGPDHEALTLDQRHFINLERLRDFVQGREDQSPLPLSSLDPTISLLDLLDSIILFYHTEAKMYSANLSIFRSKMSKYISMLEDTKTRLEQIKNNKDPESQAIQQELQRTINVFNSVVTEQVRFMTWVHAAIYSEEKQSHLAWLLRVVTLTLKNASKEGNLFTFTPDFYLEALADLCISLRDLMHPTVSIDNIPDYREMLQDVAEFLCEHFMDPRIVNVNSKNKLLVTLSGFVLNPLTLEALENIPRKSQIKVVTNLLKSYEGRAWPGSNWILLRFWNGNGFGFQHEKMLNFPERVGFLVQEEVFYYHMKPCPSVVYQNHVKKVLLTNPRSAKFLSGLLNELNWIFSDFIAMVQEIHNGSSRRERVFINSGQLKMCAASFNINVSILRVLEMTITLALSIFTNTAQSTSKNLLSRLCQLVSQILNRISSQTGCFQQVILLEIPELDEVHHYPISSAVIGILLALLSEDMTNFKSKNMKEVPKVTQTLLMEPNFQMSSLHFVLGGIKSKNDDEQNSKPYSFDNYPEYVITKEEIKKVKELIEYLDYCQTILPDPKVLSDDDNICTICYAYPLEVTFEPCHHQTCRTCIIRHLLDTKECFFCKAIIEKVVDLSGNVVHDFSNES